jgi:hypothetical protein
MPHTNIIIEILNKERAGRLCDEPALISLTVSSHKCQNDDDKLAHLSWGTVLPFLLKVPLITSVPISIMYGMTGWF